LKIYSYRVMTADFVSRHVELDWYRTTSGIVGLNHLRQTGLRLQNQFNKNHLRSKKIKWFPPKLL
jgi:hypothetical protein